jgi:hypothetical protein
LAFIEKEVFGRLTVCFRSTLSMGGVIPMVAVWRDLYIAPEAGL